MPPHWLSYFAVTSTDETATAAGRLGGETVAGPFDVPQGRIAVVRDPQGAAFGIFEGKTDD